MLKGKVRQTGRNSIPARSINMQYRINFFENSLHVEKIPLKQFKTNNLPRIGQSLRVCAHHQVSAASKSRWTSSTYRPKCTSWFCEYATQCHYKPSQVVIVITVMPDDFTMTHGAARASVDLLAWLGSSNISAANVQIALRRIMKISFWSNVTERLCCNKLVSIHRLH